MDFLPSNTGDALFCEPFVHSPSLDLSLGCSHNMSFALTAICIIKCGGVTITKFSLLSSNNHGTLWCRETTVTSQCSIHSFLFVSSLHLHLPLFKCKMISDNQKILDALLVFIWWSSLLTPCSFLPPENHIKSRTMSSGAQRRGGWVGPGEGMGNRLGCHHVEDLTHYQWYPLHKNNRYALLTDASKYDAGYLQLVTQVRLLTQASLRSRYLVWRRQSSLLLLLLLLLVE